MNRIDFKKLIIPNIPYLLFVWLFDKAAQAFRLSPGADLSGKLLSLGTGFSAALSNAAPSLHPMDLLIGIAGAVFIRLIVYFKGKNAKKYRRGMEYGSARWGNAEDIKPYVDPVFENNVILTQTERLMMSSRPKQPRFRLRQDEVFCETEPHANAQLLCCHRPERDCPCGVREAPATGRLQDKSAE